MPDAKAADKGVIRETAHRAGSIRVWGTRFLPSARSQSTGVRIVFGVFDSFAHMLRRSLPIVPEYTRPLAKVLWPQRAWSNRVASSRAGGLD